MDLEDVLPSEHPYLKKRSHIAEADSVADLIDEIENWKRGLCNWDDIEDILTKVRKDIHESTQ